MAQERGGRVENDDPQGLCCPLCGCPESTVAWTRKRVLRIAGKLQGVIVRARECQNDNCGLRFTTRERIAEETEPK